MITNQMSFLFIEFNFCPREQRKSNCENHFHMFMLLSAEKLRNSYYYQIIQKKFFNFFLYYFFRYHFCRVNEGRVSRAACTHWDTSLQQKSKAKICSPIKCRFSLLNSIFVQRNRESQILKITPAVSLPGSSK